MTRVAAAAWLLGLVFAAFLSREIRQRASGDSELDLAATLAPVVIWGLALFIAHALPVFRTSRTGRIDEKARRRVVLDYLRRCGLRGRGGRQSLPLYAVLGPRGVGKSTLLERSGSADGAGIVIGSGRLVVGPSAIFVEYPLDDRTTARDLRALLLEIRPDVPISGVLVVLSPGDLAIADRIEIDDIALALTEEARALAEVARTCLPAYLVFSKVDLVPGFREYFERLEAQDREEPWGFLVAPDPQAGEGEGENASSRVKTGGEVPARSHRDPIAAGFERMLDMMRRRHVEWLSREADPVRCNRINQFPVQIAGVPRLLGKISTALTGQEVGTAIDLRCVVMTSTRQEPLSIDALLPELSRSFALPRIGTVPPDLAIEDQDESFFVARTFDRVVLPEAGLAPSRRKLRSGSAALAALLLAFVAFVSIPTGLAAFRGFEEANMRAVLIESSINARLGQSSGEPTSIAQVAGRLRTLAALEEETKLAAKANGIFGVIVPRLPLVGATEDAFHVAIDDARARLRRDYLVPLLTHALEVRLVDPANDVENLALLLRVAEAAGEPGSEPVGTFVEAAAGELSEDDKGVFLREARLALDETGGMLPSPELVRAVRQWLARRESAEP